MPENDGGELKWWDNPAQTRGPLAPNSLTSQQNQESSYKQISRGRARSHTQPMTPAHPRANWSGVPSLTELWLEALLRAVAMLGSNVVSTLRMILRGLSGDWHTDVAPHDLPEAESDTHKETHLAAASSASIQALMVRDHEAIVSNHARGVDATRRPLRESRQRSSAHTRD